MEYKYWSLENVNHTVNLVKIFFNYNSNLTYEYPIFVNMKPKTEQPKKLGYLDKHIIGLLLQKDYWNVFYSFGVEPLLKYLEFLESEERYEDCQRVYEVIEWHNKQTGDSKPTKIDDVEA